MMSVAPRRLKAEEGFTLVELLVVIAILGILAAVAVFAIGGTTAKSKKAACKSDVATVQTAIDTYVADTGAAVTTATYSTLMPNYLRSQPSSTNGYVITISSGVLTATPACNSIT